MPEPTMADCPRCPCLEPCGECDVCDHPGIDGCRMESGQCETADEHGALYGDLCWKRHMEYYRALRKAAAVAREVVRVFQGSLDIYPSVGRLAEALTGLEVDSDG